MLSAEQEAGALRTVSEWLTAETTAPPPRQDIAVLCAAVQQHQAGMEALQAWNEKVRRYHPEYRKGLAHAVRVLLGEVR